MCIRDREEEGVDLRACLVADRATLLPLGGAPLDGMLVLAGTSPTLEAEAALRFPGLTVLTMADLTPPEGVDDAGD
jgi:hypothetical protein